MAQSEEIIMQYSDWILYTRGYSKVSGLATRSENCKWYSSMLLGAVVSFATVILCVASQW